MMNIKKEGYAVESDMMAIGPSPEMAEEEVVEAPPAMADVPEPLPGFSEPQYDMFDSGAEYASLDVMGGEVDAPVTLPVTIGKSESVSCSCEDGSSVSISR
jgi:hypothetical protein